MSELSLQITAESRHLLLEVRKRNRYWLWVLYCFISSSSIAVRGLVRRTRLLLTALVLPNLAGSTDASKMLIKRHYRFYDRHDILLSTHAHDYGGARYVFAGIRGLAWSLSLSYNSWDRRCFFYSPARYLSCVDSWRSFVILDKAISLSPGFIKLQDV